MEPSVFLRGASVVMQYGILFFLFRFLYRAVRALRPLAASMEARTRAPERSCGAVLTVVEAAGDGLSGRRFAFEDSVTLGRGADNDIVLDDSFVSQHHAIILRRRNLYAIEDTASANHTYVNDEAVTGRRYLQDGDVVRIGRVRMEFGR